MDRLRYSEAPRPEAPEGLSNLWHYSREVSLASDSFISMTGPTTFQWVTGRDWQTFNAEEVAEQTEGLSCGCGVRHEPQDGWAANDTECGCRAGQCGV